MSNYRFSRPLAGTIHAKRFYSICISAICYWLLMPAILVSAGEIDDVRTASDNAHITVRKAIAKGDGGKLASVFSSDGAVISPGGQTIEGRLTIRMTASLLLSSMGTGALTTTRQDLSIIDDRAYETGDYVMKQPLDDGKFRSYSGKYTIIWKIEEKNWKIFRVIGIR